MVTMFGKFQNAPVKKLWKGTVAILLDLGVMQPNYQIAIVNVEFTAPQNEMSCELRQIQVSCFNFD